MTADRDAEEEILPDFHPVVTHLGILLLPCSPASLQPEAPCSASRSQPPSTGTVQPKTNLGSQGPRTGAGTRPTSSSVSCYNCRRPGHIARDCLQPRRESTGLGRGTTTKDTEVKIIQSKDLEQEGDTPWLWTEAYYAGWPSRSRHHVWG